MRILDALLRLWTPTTWVIVAIVFVVQAVRGPVGRAIPELQFWLGVAPNFATGLLLPFAWDREGKPFVLADHVRRCVVVALGLCGYELAQGAGLVPAHRTFDVSDAVASVIGAGIAVAGGWLWTRRATAIAESTDQPPVSHQGS